MSTNYKPSAEDVALARKHLGFKKKVKPLSKELIMRTGKLAGKLPSTLCGKVNDASLRLIDELQR